MSFRQKNKSEGAKWRKNHREELLAAGLPESIIDDERRWTYLLLHGDDQFGSGWWPSHITNEQAARLLQLLRVCSPAFRRSGILASAFEVQPSKPPKAKLPNPISVD